ncbi:E1-like protein-activating enzyme Gsa7p/Apg7p [Kwoniella mangroviensis CBS 8507]|uniref:Ubiquitin-like modifier-activating enzyme ATG7 n=1 Tax=Kwoniella mangrovensis TaxID=463800 RepID=N0E6S0_9TREE|nr:E1-like protein-activating enzyme Gsa7p/Apg7p [Kwoniella mangroviensis CBS 8507]OCF68911.1 E1-like protein-activating enzyme Gsa7p/Apg7p [Kwoniella mangroviensis CBS 8507]CCM73225.1 CNI00160p [Kwoniella mangrovensis]
MTTLQFTPLNSQPTPAFWTALTTHKLDKARLNDDDQQITGWLEEGKQVEDHSNTSSTGGPTYVGIDGNISVGGNAFGESSESIPAASIPVTGILKNFNTIEEFRKTETKKEIFNQVVAKIVGSFKSDQPLINPFLLVTFADLKKYIFHYWFAFPAFVSSPAWRMNQEVLTPVQETDLRELRQLEAQLSSTENRKFEAFLVKGIPGSRSIAPLPRYQTFYSDVVTSQITVAFHDPSSSDTNPGWPLRNILHYLNQVYGTTKVMVFCLRQGRASRQAVVTLPREQQGSPDNQVSSVGWERTKEGKLASRIADLGPMMNPVQLAEQAVDLNLKLMKWRIAPGLDLEAIARTKCLLLGAGTLGCYVARNLMAWGVRNITFVDSARVSFSNPVRQPLFRFEDCLNGGRSKAVCAAERLTEIFPGIIATGHSITIPMPGHPIPPSASAAACEDIRKLEELISQHDVIFLLMDSRESRWLPTLISMNQSKIVINAALGFDTYLVMRHGVVNGDGDAEQLGCYYCNDVVAPTDSLTDRTLDQMCTVTRPGAAPLAAATATELLISLLQHPLKAQAPAYEPAVPAGEDEAALGPVPHQIRGILSQWKTMIIRGPAYNQCTACSPLVLDAYRQGGAKWLLEVFARAELLEQVTGLDQLHIQSEEAFDSIDWSDDSGSEV